MVAHAIEYVEIYTDDPKKSVDYFASSFGFSEIARSEGADGNSVLLRQGGVQLMITAGPITGGFCAAHGDGVANIAFACDDVAATRDRALAARPRQTALAPDPLTTVSGFGDIMHTLVQRRTGALRQLPADRVWTLTAPAEGDSGTSRIQEIDHVAVCLDAGTLENVVDFYIRAFGFERYYSEYVSVGDQAMYSVVVRSPSGGITFTILQPDRLKNKGQIDEFLIRNGGSGVQHLAFLTAEIASAVREFRAQGIDFLKAPGTYYDLLGTRMPGMQDEMADLRDVNVLADRDEWGDLLQLFTRSPYQRRTLFYELIERRGAQGFGSANIRALYEAVERERVAST